MKLGIISDTHGSFSDFEDCMSALGNCDLILHLGDVLYHGPRNPLPVGYDSKELAGRIYNMNNIIFVRGNCDSDVDMMVTGKDMTREYRIVNVDEHTILATHGYMKSIDKYISLAKSFGCDIVVFGHSHVKHDEVINGIRVLNPGSPSLPKDGSRSCILIENGNIKFIDLDLPKGGVK